MYESLLGNNKYLLQLDPERHAAHRAEIKRALAEVAVKTSRIDDLKDILKRLDADSDQAAEEHTAAASKLQSELDALDREQVECVLSNVSTPAKSLLRRRLILDELTELNQTLEVRCEANRRSKQPIEKQITELADEINTWPALQNQLVALCSVSLRQQMLFNERKLQLVTAGLKEANRVLGVIEHNAHVCKLNHDSEGASIAKLRWDDAKAVVDAMQDEIQELHTEAARLRDAALAE